MAPRGKLKVFLGYAAGVGKTYQMLIEAQALQRAGQDVVIGYFEPHGRAETIAQTVGLEFVPRRVYAHRGARFEDMDTNAVMARHPQVAVVDEFAHTNVPGAERSKRWEDVQAILSAGIDVLTSLNIQHIESLNDQVWHVTGVRVRETVPDWLLQEAAEVVMVDVPPMALIHRLERGVVYSREKALAALENFFTETNLTALRELAMRQTAQKLEQLPAPVRGLGAEKILIWLTCHPSTVMLIRRGRRVADYLDSVCMAVYLETDLDGAKEFIRFCGSLRIAVEGIDGEDGARVVTDFARARGVTQIFVTRHAPEMERLVGMARDMQITIVAERQRD